MLLNNKKPLLITRYTVAGVLGGFFSLWGKFSFVPESPSPVVDIPLHSYRVPLVLTTFYLVSLPLLKFAMDNYLSKIWDMKLLLREAMILYNIGQVLVNVWMVWRFLDAILNRGHPFIGDNYTLNSYTVYAIWIHYCNKYLEFFDTYFMVLRGRMDQVNIQQH